MMQHCDYTPIVTKDMKVGYCHCFSALATHTVSSKIQACGEIMMPVPNALDRQGRPHALGLGELEVHITETVDLLDHPLPDLTEPDHPLEAHKDPLAHPLPDLTRPVNPPEVQSGVGKLHPDSP
jgi:hypothetical protein